MVVNISCGNSTAPVNIDKNKVIGPCLLKCDYRHSYGIYTPNIKNNDNYLSLNYSGKSNPVKFNDVNYQVQEIRMYRPSLHTYGNKRADGEILIIHGGSGKNLIVSVPFMVGGKTDKGSTQLSSVLSEAIKRAPTKGSAVTLSLGDFSLDNFIPSKRGFFSYNGTLPYKPCNGAYSYVVYSIDDALNISSKVFDSLKKTITDTSVDIKSNNYFYNKNGSNVSSGENDDIYIDCQPVGEDGQVLVNETITGKSLTSGGNMNVNMEEIEPFLYVIGGLILALGISYGVNHLFKKFKKDQ